MKKVILLMACLLSLNLIGCTTILKPYRPPVQQGNLITDAMIEKLKPGMTKDQVSDIFGEPVLANPFDQNTWTYVYTFQPSQGPSKKKVLIVYFRNGRVSNYTVSLPSPKLKKENHF